eukprot:4818150-Amphidinium_carterae.2
MSERQDGSEKGSWRTDLVTRKGLWKWHVSKVHLAAKEPDFLRSLAVVNDSQQDDADQDGQLQRVAHK